MILMLKVSYLLWLFFFFLHSKEKNADLHEHMFWVRINSCYDCNTQLIYIELSNLQKHFIIEAEVRILNSQDHMDSIIIVYLKKKFTL